MVTPSRATRAVAALAVWTLLVSLDAAALNARMYLERNPVRVDETVRLVIEVDDDLGDAEPDLAALGADFVVLGTSTSRSVNIVNGRRSNMTRWWVELEPRREGMVQIPALTVGGVATEPIALEVLAANAASPTPREVALETHFEPVNAYVNGQLTFVVRLELAVSISNGSLSEPDIPGAVVERLGEDTNSEVRRAGRRWRVIERRYAVFPEAAGELVVAPLRFSGRVSAGFSSDMFGGSVLGNSRALRARSDQTRIVVKDEPAQFGGSTWLPARELRVFESHGTGPPTLRVGEPLTRAITIEALGLRGEQLPPLEFPAPASVRTYPDQAQTRTGRDGDRVVGIREERVAIVPTEAGELILPAIRVPWWDIEQDMERVAEIPMRRIEVLPAGSGMAVVAPPAPDAPLVESVPDIERRLPWREYAGIVFALLWLVTLAAWWRARRDRAPVALRPAPDPGVSVRRNVLKTACRNGDAAAASGALAVWAKHRWPEDTPGSLTELAARLDNEALRLALRELDRALYAQAPDTWDGASLWRAFDGLSARRTHRRQAGRHDPLAALHPGTPAAGR